MAVGKTKGLTVVVNQGAVVYGGLDVTADVTAQLKKPRNKDLAGDRRNGSWADGSVFC